MPTYRLLITRHGETDWNRERRIQGNTDLDLNEAGIAQAVSLAERLSSVGMSAVYSSDLKRASHTAQIIIERNPGVIYTQTPLLKERNWGVFEGRRWNEIFCELPPEIREYHSHPMDFAPEGGESRNCMMERIKRFLDETLSRHEGETILIVTHGGIASLMIKYLIGFELSCITPFRIENCSVNVLDFAMGKKWMIHCLNDVSHLPELRIV